VLPPCGGPDENLHLFRFKKGGKGSKKPFEMKKQKKVG
jgi:hypothetical protein